MKRLAIFLPLLLSGCSTQSPLECVNGMGDLDYDGAVTNIDAAIILDVSLGIKDVNDCQLRAADMNGDGAITQEDAQIAFDIFMDS